MSCNMLDLDLEYHPKHHLPKAAKNNGENAEKKVGGVSKRVRVGTVGRG